MVDNIQYIDSASISILSVPSKLTATGSLFGTSSYSVTSSHAITARSASHAFAADTANTANSASVITDKQYRVWIGTDAGTGLVNSTLSSFDVSYGGASATAVFGAENNLFTRTNNTNKIARLAYAPYNSARRAVAMVLGNTASGSSTLQLGGGSTVLDPSTQVEIWTGPIGGNGISQMTVDVNGNVTMSNQLTVGGITSSLNGNASTATTASHALTASYVPDLYPQTEQVSASWASSSFSSSYLSGSRAVVEQIGINKLPQHGLDVWVPYTSSLSDSPGLNVLGKLSGTFANSAQRLILAGNINCGILIQNQNTNSYTIGAFHIGSPATKSFTIFNEQTLKGAININGNNDYIGLSNIFTPTTQLHLSGTVSASLFKAVENNNVVNFIGTSSFSETASYVPNLYPQTEQVSASWASASLSSSYPWTALPDTTHLAGNVGIGTLTPGVILPSEFSQSSAGGRVLEIRNISPNTNDVALLLRRSDNVVGLDLHVNNAGTSPTSPYATIFNNRYINSDYVFQISGSEKMRLTSTGILKVPSSISSSLTGNATTATSASHAANAVSASYAPVQPSYSASISTQFGTKQDTLVTGNTYAITSSWAQRATSASWAPATVVVVSSSWASASLRLSNNNAYITTTGMAGFGNNLIGSDVLELRGDGNNSLIQGYYSGTGSGIFTLSEDGLGGTFLNVNDAATNYYVTINASNLTSSLNLSNNFNSNKVYLTSENDSYFLNNGNVGIGTSIPNNKLTVVGNISASWITASLNGTASYFNSSALLNTGSGEQSVEDGWTINNGQTTIDITGKNINIVGNIQLNNGRLFGTASYATSSISSSHSLIAISASHALTANTATTATTATNATNAGFATTAGSATTATTAAYADNVYITNANDGGANYLTFMTAAVSLPNYADLRVTSGISVDPSGNSIYATSFQGALIGNASTATTASHGITSRSASHALFANIATSSLTSDLSTATNRLNNLGYIGNTEIYVSSSGENLTIYGEGGQEKLTIPFTDGDTLLRGHIATASLALTSLQTNTASYVTASSSVIGQLTASTVVIGQLTSSRVFINDTFDCVQSLWNKQSQLIKFLTPYSFTAVGTGASSANYDGVGSWGSIIGTTTGSYTQALFGRQLTRPAGYSGLGIDFNRKLRWYNALGHNMSGEPNACLRFVAVTTASAAVIAKDADALTSNGIGVEFLSNVNGVRIFCHNGTTYTTSSIVTYSTLPYQRMYAFILESTGTGTVNFYFAEGYGEIPLVPETPTLTISNGPTTVTGGNAFAHAYISLNSGSAVSVSVHGAKVQTFQSFWQTIQ